MPSVNSSSSPMVGDSSTVMTPSLPTLSNASAITSPIWASCAETVATWAISCRSLTSRASLSRRSDTADAAASMPRLSEIGFAPALTLRRPSWTIACASTVAVVVPSPAMSLVLVATSLASWAPRCSYGSSSSTARATVTPSFVIVGAPHFLSMTTLRPFGPSVTLTAFASASTPRSSDLRAESLNSSSLAIAVLRDRDAVGGRGFALRSGGMVVQSPVPDAPRSHPVAGAHRGAVTAYVVRASADDGEHVTGGQDEVLLAAVLDLGAAVLAV